MELRSGNAGWLLILALPLLVLPAAATAQTNAPASFGAIDTPSEGTTGVTGLLPVTGWAVGDLGVSAVRIYRSAVSPEPAGTKVYLGDATQIDGARPDVAAAYPSMPGRTRAGWGYMLQTTALPNQGNGTFTVYAYAEDSAGYRALIGSRTFSAENLGAAQPFGAIDTPKPGAVVSGTAYANFGWALTPQPNMVPPDGSSITVLVDGVPVGHPGALGPRQDIQAVYPGYANTNAAVGAFFLDTTAYADGLHTIAWSVRDSGGHASTIDGHYFVVQNGPARDAAAAMEVVPDSINLPAFGHDRGGPVYVRLGYDASAPFEEVPYANGTRTVVAQEIDWIVMKLADPSEAPSGWSYEGFLVYRDEVTRLPIGSTLDAAQGIFYWLPGPAFIGTYDLLFLRSAGDGRIEQVSVEVTIQPKFEGGPSDLLMSIDTPTAGAVMQPFAVAGWAIDRGALAGTGVNTLHVWAYPVTSSGYGPAIFLGAAHYGDLRPDVGLYFGARFAPSAYGLIVSGLAPGTYDVAVFPFSLVTDGFQTARVRRVTVH